jgi:hypothetical protein
MIPADEKITCSDSFLSNTYLWISNRYGLHMRYILVCICIAGFLKLQNFIGEIREGFIEQLVLYREYMV